jgi:hypothetical protein
MNLKDIVKKLKQIWELPEEQNHLYGHINELDRKINERTTVHCDIGFKGTGSQVIIIGKYRGKDYVRAFNVRTASLGPLIEIMKTEEEGAAVGRFDMIGGMEFSAVYDQERF